VAVQPVVLTAEGDVVTSEQPVEHLDSLSEPRHSCRAVVEADADRLVLGGAHRGASAKTELDTSSRKRVERQYLACDERRVAQSLLSTSVPIRKVEVASVATPRAAKG
jgi:hypothetical protein